MQRLLVAAGIACAIILTNSAGAQNPTNPGGFAMPGQVVGSYRGQVNPVGQKAPSAAPAAGQPITANAMQRPFDPNHPYDIFKGTNIDPNSVVAPLVGPDGKQVVPPDALDKLSEKIKAIWGFAAQAPPRPPYTPGITRRTKERYQQPWRRD
jgi:hypothetical protein